MNAQQRANLRVAVLTVLHTNQTRFGLGLDAITLHVSSLGFAKVTAPEVETAMFALEDEKMICRLPDRLTPGVHVWRITDEGRNYVAENL